MEASRFEEVWTQFQWVLAEMRGGMGFFEGYVPSVRPDGLLEALSGVARLSSEAFAGSVWSNQASSAVVEGHRSPVQWVEHFRGGGITTLHFDYVAERGGADLSLKLMLDSEAGATSLEVVCYREGILESGDPKGAVRAAIEEFMRLREVFRGDALFIGPETLNRPRGAEDVPGEWLRVE